ncbi:unnamed protein product [Rotaria sordida]|uniref:AMP-binding enzyme C-terminal domain-containing protein n=1 Tax=Rotaria sordida TaxID=392033 RepID=A0A818PZG9_9BILA|nr:unnamed protein product [Rotaria sordida]
MQVRVLDKFYQPVVPGMDGELFIAGIQRFSGYYDREDLTRAALFGSFYRTGDLVRMDNRGLLHYIGRKDNQIKLHGQRIEPGEIERCLLETSISACAVIKEGDDHLVAYVQNCHMNEEQLREYCRQHLPSYMIPSKFIVLEQMPLNRNGKLDRMQLPRVKPVRVHHQIRLPSTLILSWLGVDIQGTNIKLANVVPFLRFPSHLLFIGDNVTTFGDAQLVPFDVDNRGQCTVDSVKLNNGVTLGNDCSVHPGTFIPVGTLVGTLTPITRDTQCVGNNILLGIPACSMPFVLPSVETKPAQLTGKSIVFELPSFTIAFPKKLAAYLL